MIFQIKPKLSFGVERTKGIVALVILAVIYAGTGVVTRYLSLHFTILQQIYWRILIAFILGLVIFPRQFHFGKILKITSREWLLLTARSTANFLFAAPLWIAGANIAKLANVGFIDSLPITAFFSLVLHLEKGSLEKTILIFLSFIGILILSVKDLTSISSFGFGEFLILLSGFFFAYRNFSRIWHTKLLNDLEITQVMFFLGFIVVFATSLILGEKLIIPNWSGELIFMLILGGVIMIANIFLTNYGFARVSPVLGSIIINLEAVLAMFFGFIFYGEVLTLRELLGGLLIVTTVFGMSKLKQ